MPSRNSVPCRALCISQLMRSEAAGLSSPVTSPSVDSRVAASQTTNGPSAPRLILCSALAANSFPVPGSPLTSTARKCGPIRRTCNRSRCIAAPSPTIPKSSRSDGRGASVMPQCGSGGRTGEEQAGEYPEVNMASPYIGRTRLQVSHQKAKAGDDRIATVISGSELVLSLRSRLGAVRIERPRKLLGDRRCCRGLNRRPLHQVHQLSIAQNRNRQRGRRMSAEVAACLLGRLAILTGEHRHRVLRCCAMLHRQPNPRTHLARRATANRVHHHHRRSGLGHRGINLCRTAYFLQTGASQLLAHRNHHNLWIHKHLPFGTAKTVRQTDVSLDCTGSISSTLPPVFHPWFSARIRGRIQHQPCCTLKPCKVSPFPSSRTSP